MPSVQTPSTDDRSPRVTPVVKQDSEVSPFGVRARNFAAQLWNVDVRSLAVFRISLALILLFDLVIRASDLEAFYTDLGLLTANADIGDDATDLFNYMTGFSRPREYTHLMVAPVNLRTRMLALIERESSHALAGRQARMVVKINRLTDLEIIDALYRASQAGVEIDLIVRGSCMLRPGVPGLSENIRIRSVVGRFLEHSRVFYFANGGDDDVYIGSADWMTRNLNRRVEVVTPILDGSLKRYLKDVVLGTYLKDNVKARILSADGSYERVPTAPGEAPFNSQMHFEGSISLSSERQGRD